MGVLGELDVALYRLLLNEPPQELDRVADTLNRPTAELQVSLDRLRRLGLLRHTDEGRYLPVSPMLAEATVLGAEDLDLANRRASIEARRAELRQLVPDWDAAFTESGPRWSVDVIDDPRLRDELAIQYAAGCQRELMTTSPGRIAPTRVADRTRVADAFSRNPDVKRFVVYQQSAITDPITRRHLTARAKAGARVRLAEAVPGRCLIIDRRVGLLSIGDEDTGLVVIREPALVSWLVISFEQLWAGAKPLAEYLHAPAEPPTPIPDTLAAILRLLGEGEKDEAISRRLSISVRTCRRYIADYMAQVGATSRFQAGVIAARHGHTLGSGERDRDLDGRVGVLPSVE